MRGIYATVKERKKVKERAERKIWGRKGGRKRKCRREKKGQKRKGGKENMGQKRNKREKKKGERSRKEKEKGSKMKTIQFQNFQVSKLSKIHSLPSACMKQISYKVCSNAHRAINHVNQTLEIGSYRKAIKLWRKR